MASVIEVKELSKKYRISKPEKQADTFAGTILKGLKQPFDNLRQIHGLSQVGEDDESIFWALKDVSFNVNEGEVLGIIGHNGAGKSTLLKILSRITEPTAGEVRIYGRVAALLEVGTGFHPELTGRENVYMNGTILGMTKKEIDRKFDAIVDFSGVEKHLDTVVKFYSSGMKVRLGFAVAAHLEPEVLIIDEVLAVGDAEFQSKCLGKMESVAKNGRTIIFVSHDLGAIQSLCPKSILLHRGLLTHYDNSDVVVSAYLNKSLTSNDAQDFSNRFGNGNIKILAAEITDESGNKLSEVQTGQKFSIQISYASEKYNQLPPFTYFHVFCKSHSGVKLFVLSSKYSISDMISSLNSNGRIRCEVESLPLLPGNYHIDICCKLSEDTEDYVYDALKLNVISGRFPGYSRLPNNTAGSFLIKQSWSSS